MALPQMEVQQEGRVRSGQTAQAATRSACRALLTLDPDTMDGVILGFCIAIVPIVICLLLN